MPFPNNALGADQGSLFIQIHSNDTPEYMGCVDLADVPEPSGDQTLFYCRNTDGKLESIGSVSGTPAQGTTSLTIPTFANSDLFDRIKNCEFTLFAMTDSCGKLGVFNNYSRGTVMFKARRTNKNRQNLVMRESAEKSLRVMEISYQGVYDLYTLNVAQQTIAETRNLNTIVFDLDNRCVGDCGAAKDPNDIGYIGASGSAGSPTSDADVWATDNKGTTWANATGAVPSPFAGGDIKSSEFFQMDKNTWRLLVASSGKAGNAQIAYSDNGGATWTTVTVGSTAWEGAAHASALFAFDRAHIWFATDHGRVYFSGDAGVTWTSQASALTASAAKSLNAVKFSDYDNGFAAGNSDALIKTNDGGSTWTAITTTPTTSDNITALWVISKYALLVGSNADQLFKSLNAGVTWTAVAFTGQGTTGTVNGIDSRNSQVLFMIHNTSAPLGSVHISIDGGMSWQRLTTPTNAGLNDVIAIDENLCYVVGNAYGGTGFVAKISG